MKRDTPNPLSIAVAERVRDPLNLQRPEKCPICDIEQSTRPLLTQRLGVASLLNVTCVSCGFHFTCAVTRALMGLDAWFLKLGGAELPPLATEETRRS